MTEVASSSNQMRCSRRRTESKSIPLSYSLCCEFAVIEHQRTAYADRQGCVVQLRIVGEDVSLQKDVL